MSETGPKPAWRIFYADGSTFSSIDGAAEDAPGWGVVAIAFADREVGRKVLCDFDFYLFLRVGGWIGVQGTDAVLDHVINTPETLHCAKAGRTLARRQYLDVLNAALDDPDFPTKTHAARDEQPR